jgi:hypothetical protein
LEISLIGRAGMSRETQELSGNMENFVGTLFLFSEKKTCAKRKMDMKLRWLKKR